MIGVSLRTNPNRLAEPQYRNYHCQALAQPDADTLILTGAALAALAQIYLPGYAYQKTGVILLGISPSERVQYDLFTPPPDPRRAKLMHTIDRLNQRHDPGHWQ